MLLQHHVLFCKVDEHLIFSLVRGGSLLLETDDPLLFEHLDHLLPGLVTVDVGDHRHDVGEQGKMILAINRRQCGGFFVQIDEIYIQIRVIVEAPD